MRYSLLHKSVITDPMLYELFDRLDDAGRVAQTFCEGHVTTHHEFRDLCRREDVHLWAMCADGDPDGFIFLNNVQIKKAWAHFAFFGRIHPLSECRLGKFSVASLLHLREPSGAFILDVLHGFTPKSNVQACRYVRLIGMKRSGELPLGIWDAYAGQNEDCIMSYATRDLFPERYLHENLY